MGERTEHVRRVVGDEALPPDSTMPPPYQLDTPPVASCRAAKNEAPCAEWYSRSVVRALAERLSASCRLTQLPLASIAPAARFATPRDGVAGAAPHDQSETVPRPSRSPSGSMPTHTTSPAAITASRSAGSYGSRRLENVGFGEWTPEAARPAAVR